MRCVIMKRQSKKQRTKKIKTLTKGDMYLGLYTQMGYSRQGAAELINSVFGIIKQKLCSNHNVRLSGFGNFLLKDKKPRRGRNPQTGRAITIKGRRVLTFCPSPVLKKKVNGR